MPDRPTKTFGLSTPMDVWIKIRFDLDRLKAARSTKDLQYAALDCAIWSFHLIEWVLNEVDDDVHIRLSGKKRDGKKIIEGFIQTNAAVLKTLAVCHQIALTSKHRVLTISIDDPDWETGHTVRFSPSFDAANPRAPLEISAVAYLRNADSSNEIGAVAFFQAVVDQWEYFLKKEGLFCWGWEAVTNPSTPL